MPKAGKGKKDSGKKKEATSETRSEAPEAGCIAPCPSGSGLLLSVRVQPGCSHSEVSEASEREVKLRLGAPPVDGAANTEAVKFAAKVLGLRKSDVQLVQGHKARDKTLRLTGTLSKEEVLAKLRQHV